MKENEIKKPHQPLPIYDFDRIDKLMGWKRSNLDSEISETTDRPEGDGLMNRGRIKRRVVIDGQQIWITADNEQEYFEKLMEMSRQNDVPVNTVKHDFREYAETWFKVFSKPNIAEVTAITYKRQLENHIYPVFEGMAIEDITPANVQEMLNQISAVKETKNKARTVLNMILEQAIEDNLIDRNPLKSKSIRIVGRGPKETPPYTVEQMQRLANKICDLTNPIDRAYLAFQAFHPLRLEEVLGLKFEDIDRKELKIHVRRAVTHPARNSPEIKAAKTEASNRTIDLSGDLLEYIPTGPDKDFVLGGKKPLSYQQVKRMHDRIQRELKFEEKISPRRFRTTVLTDIYDTTKDIKAAQAAAGHTTSAMTLKHYVKGRSSNINTANAVTELYGLKKTGTM